MRSSRNMLAVAVLAAATILGSAAPALAATHAPHGNAAPHESSAKLISVVHQTGAGTAEVKARYTCIGEPEQLHLWVSVKQTADRTADPALAIEGSSGVSAAWSQSHSGVLTCDGKMHVDWFSVDQTEQGFGTLARGMAWVQFCMFDATTPEPAGPISDMEFMRVR
jgi:hypothetical protein